MANGNTGEQSPVPLVEVGDAPDLTRLMNPQPRQGKGPYDNDKKVVVASWSSLEKFANEFKHEDGRTWWHGENVKKSWYPEWNGCDSFAEAIDLALYGWKEGGEIIERTRGYVRALNPLSPRIQRYGIAGSTPNVPRAIAGHVLNMKMPEPGKSRKRQIITVVYNMCENGGMAAEMITNKAAVTAALIDEIEAKGFACEVIATVVTHGYRPAMSCYEYVRIKESHHPVDINRLAFGLGHAAMFRGLFFADMQSNEEFKDIGYGLGCAATTFPSKELTEQQIYTVTSTDKGTKSAWWKTQDLAVTKGLDGLVRELQKQGCPAFPKLKDHEDDLEKNAEEDHSDYEEPEPYWS